MGNARFVIHKSGDNQWYFTYEAENGQVIVTSETYTQKHNCRSAIKSLKKGVPTAEIVDETK